MKKNLLIKSIIKEYGFSWAVNRTLYALKLKAMAGLPGMEGILENKKPKVKNLDVFHIDASDIKRFLQNLPEREKQELIQDADDAGSGRIKAFSSTKLDYGNPIKWHYNPLTDKECPADKKWYRIPDFDAERGDIKLIWEASRLSHFYLFSRAYLLTGDVKYYQAFSEQVDSWVKNNSYSFGANYKCGQENALRMVNCLMNYTVFQKEGITSAQDTANVKILVENAYRKILNNFFYAHKCIKNNHTISELLGMMIGAKCCEDEKKLRYAYKTLEKVLAEQFLEDGGYRQFSFNYQRLALQDIECVLSIGHATGYDLSEKAKKRILQSARLLFQVQSPDGDVPNYGSNDGALIFPVTGCGYRDFRPIVNTIYYLITGKRVYAPGIYDEELIWFSDGHALSAAIENISQKSEKYLQAGLFSIRNKNTHLLAVLNDFTSRPCQFDQMHMDLWIDYKNVLCDSGSYSYASELGTKLAATEGHNTVLVRGRQQMNKRGSFLIYSWTKRKRPEFDGKDFCGEMASANGYTHQRRIITEEMDDNLCYTLYDEIKTDTETEYDILFHTPYQTEIIENGVLIHENGQKLCSVTGGSCEVTDGERSLYYMRTEPIKLIRFHGKTENLSGKNKLTIKILEKRKTDD